MEAAKLPYLTFDEYVEGERDSEIRHEYVDGQVYAMAGASDRHELVSGNLFATLHGHLRGGPWRVFKSDMMLRLRLATSDVGYYPDLMVACDPTDTHRYYREQPKLLIEILSQDMDHDLVTKYLAYQKIPALEEYAVFSQDPEQPRVRIFRNANDWNPGVDRTDGAFRFESIGLDVELAPLYRL